MPTGDDEGGAGDAQAFPARPAPMPARAWAGVLYASWARAGEDNIGIVAAGIAFYGVLALVPLLGATVLCYGLLANPQTVLRDVAHLAQVMPPDVAALLGRQMMRLVESSDSRKGVGVFVALALAVFSARGGARSVITALNIAYERRDRRGFVHVNLLAIGMTAGGVLVTVIGFFAVSRLGAMGQASVGALESHVPGGSVLAVWLDTIASYAGLAAGTAGLAGILYRFGPDRAPPPWRWLIPGALLTALLWLLLTLAFGLYAATFGHYDATYGSFGAVIVLLTWLYLSSYALLFGAELSSQLEARHRAGR